MFETIEEVFQTVVRYGILALEAVGAIIILFFSVKSFLLLLRGSTAKSRMALTEGITSGLSFLLGSEVLRTIIAPDWTDIGMTCAILLMRAGVTVLVRWENKEEKENS